MRVIAKLEIMVWHLREKIVRIRLCRLALLTNNCSSFLAGAEGHFVEGLPYHYGMHLTATLHHSKCLMCVFHIASPKKSGNLASCFWLAML